MFYQPRVVYKISDISEWNKVEYVCLSFNQYDEMFRKFVTMYKYLFLKNPSYHLPFHALFV